MSYQQGEALFQFLRACIGSDGNFYLPVDIDKHLASLVKRFGYALIACEDRQYRDDSSLKAITRAIRKLSKLEQRVSVNAVAKTIRMNYRRCRQLMVKYGLYDVTTKQVVNLFDDWKQLGYKPLEDPPYARPESHTGSTERQDPDD